MLSVETMLPCFIVRNLGDRWIRRNVATCTVAPRALEIVPFPSARAIAPDWSIRILALDGLRGITWRWIGIRPSIPRNWKVIKAARGPNKPQPNFALTGNFHNWQALPSAALWVHSLRPFPLTGINMFGLEGQMSELIRRFWSEDEGQDIAEYAVMLAVILVLVVGTIRLIGSNANNVFSNTASSIQ
jgi:Flp pilus assembly pilin Flp